MLQLIVGRSGSGKTYTVYEELKKYVTTTCPKYGNDDDRADLIMKDLLDEYGKRKQYFERSAVRRDGGWMPPCLCC